METIFSKMTALANKHGAINLAQGFPDFDIQPELVDILSGINAENNHQYAPYMGLPELREDISKLIKKSYQTEIQLNNILITSGATEGLYATFLGLISPGDEVLIFDPCYDSYVPAIERAGGVPIRIPLLAPNFTYQFEDYKEKITNRTKFVVLNNPHNPLGTTISEEEFISFKKMVLEFNLTVVSDEVYEFISYDKHFSVLEDEELRNRSVVISSFGKTLHLTGWKMGYLSAPDHLLSKIVQIHQFLVFSVHRPSQMAISKYLRLKNHNVSPLEMFREKKTMIDSQLLNSNFKLLPSKGTYFQVLDYSDISDLGDVGFCEWLTQDKKVAAIPISVFYENGLDQKLIRLCYAKKNETLTKAMKILCKI